MIMGRGRYSTRLDAARSRIGSNPGGEASRRDRAAELARDEAREESREETFSFFTPDGEFDIDAFMAAADMTYSTPTPEIPDELRFTRNEQTFLDEIEEYRRLEADGRGHTMGAREPEMEELQAQNGRLQIAAAEARISALQRTVNHASEMIAQRRAEGYTGRSRSYSEYRTLMRDLRTASDDERGAILSSASVGREGIRYWQVQRKNAERSIERLRFAIKLQRRYEAGITT